MSSSSGVRAAPILSISELRMGRRDANGISLWIHFSPGLSKTLSAGSGVVRSPHTLLSIHALSGRSQNSRAMLGVLRAQPWILTSQLGAPAPALGICVTPGGS